MVDKFFLFFSPPPPPASMLPPWLSPRFVTSFWAWKSRLRRNSVSRLQRLRNRRRNSPSWPRPPPALPTYTATRSLCLLPVTTRHRRSHPRQSGVWGPSPPLTFTCEPTTSMCRQTTSKRPASLIFCPKTSWRNSLSSLISGHRWVCDISGYFSALLGGVGLTFAPIQRGEGGVFCRHRQHSAFKKQFKGAVSSTSLSVFIRGHD